MIPLSSLQTIAHTDVSKCTKLTTEKYQDRYYSLSNTECSVSRKFSNQKKTSSNPKKHKYWSVRQTRLYHICIKVNSYYWRRFWGAIDQNLNNKAIH